MSIILSTLIGSFLLEGIASNYISVGTNFFAPLFTIIALVIVYPYFNNNDSEYFVVAFIYGLIYDLTYTDTIMFYAIIFLFIAFIIKLFNIWLSNHIVNVTFISLSVIIIYRLVVYLLLVLVGYLNYNYWILLKGFYSSIILNLVYMAIIYIITEYFSNKYHIRRTV